MYQSLENWGDVTEDVSFIESSTDKPINLLEKPKHAKLFNTSELDKIKDFDPITDKVDRLIMNQVMTEREMVR